MVYGKMFTICEKFSKRATTWHALQKEEYGWMCTMDEKRWYLYKWGGRKRTNPYGMCTIRIVFNVKCLKQHD